ncbi:MAG: 2-C-methyl-D-erythritol 4-phosphate cytidylyltransferase [Candidatus Omnitrophica bacterium]|nr:2-C-methyl-D-erythritol 4-phosphate cytidylyltransferase [Candidatus Omnitrophota bacterium]
MKVVALVPAAGSGERLGRASEEKPFLEIGGKPLLAHVLSRLSDSGRIDRIVVMVKDKYLERTRDLIRGWHIEKVQSVVPGGVTRTESVRNGIEEASPGEDELVLIHDGARPFVTGEVIERAVDLAARTGAAVVGLPCDSTIKKVSGDLTVEETPPRSGLWEAQTPQVFSSEVIREAYRAYAGGNVTDDSSLVEMSGRKVKMVKGTRDNIKITVPEDIRLAEAILAGERAE